MGETNIIPFPKEKPDVQEMMLDGKPETMLSARGVVLTCLSSWKLDGNENAYGCLQRYCEYTIPIISFSIIVPPLSC